MHYICTVINNNTMKIELKEIERYGTPVIRYKMNTLGTRHLFLYKYKGLHYCFCKFKGRLVLNAISEVICKSEEIDSSKINGSIVREWFNSSLNEWFNSSSKWAY